MDSRVLTLHQAKGRLLGSHFKSFQNKENRSIIQEPYLLFWLDSISSPNLARERCTYKIVDRKTNATTIRFFIYCVLKFDIFSRAHVFREIDQFSRAHGLREFDKFSRAHVLREFDQFSRARVLHEFGINFQELTFFMSLGSIFKSSRFS